MTCHELGFVRELFELRRLTRDINHLYAFLPKRYVSSIHVLYDRMSEESRRTRLFFHCWGSDSEREVTAGRK